MTGFRHPVSGSAVPPLLGGLLLRLIAPSGRLESISDLGIIEEHRRADADTVGFAV